MKKIYFSFLFSFCALLYSQEKWSLEKCINHAKKNNLQVINSQYNKSFQEKNLAIAKKDFLPSVNGNLENTVSFGQTQGFQGSIGRNDNFNNNIGVSANLLLFGGGRLLNNRAIAEYSLEAANNDVLSTQNNVSLQVIQLYLSILLNKELVKVMENSLKTAQDLYKKAEKTTEIGVTPRATLIQAEANLAKEQQNLKTAEINVNRSLFNLALLLQLKDYQSFDIEDVSIDNILSLTNPLSNKTMEDVIEMQPQIKAGKSRVKASQARIKLAQSAYYPTVTASIGLGSFYFNSLVTNTIGLTPEGNIIKEKSLFNQYKTNFAQRLNLSVSIPIFNKGITQLQVQQAKINELVAENNLKIERQQLLQDIQKAQFDNESYLEAYISAQEAERSAKLALDYAEKSYKAGVINIYDYNLANNHFIDAQGKTLQAKYNFYFSVKLLEFYLKD